MSRLTCLWNVLFLASGSLLAETVLPVQDHQDFQVRVSDGGHMLTLVHEYGGKELVVVSPRMMMGSGATAYYQASDGSKQPVTQDGQFVGRVVAADGRWVFLLLGDGPAQTGVLVDMTDGRIQKLPLTGVPTASSVQGDLVAVSTHGKAQDQVSVFKCEGGALIGSMQSPVSTPVTQLYLAGPERLIIVDASLPRVYNVRISDTLKLNSSYDLTGSEVSDSRSRSGRLVAAPGASFADILVLGHTTSKSGDDLFFLSGSSGNKGIRMVQFDSAGRQTASYRLVDDGWKERGTLFLQPQFIRASDERISVIAQNGIASSFQRP